MKNLFFGSLAALIVLSSAQADDPSPLGNLMKGSKLIMKKDAFGGIDIPPPPPGEKSSRLIIGIDQREYVKFGFSLQGLAREMGELPIIENKKAISFVSETGSFVSHMSDAASSPDVAKYYNELFNGNSSYFDKKLKQADSSMAEIETELKGKLAKAKGSHMKKLIQDLQKKLADGRKTLAPYIAYGADHYKYCGLYLTPEKSTKAGTSVAKRFDFQSTTTRPITIESVKKTGPKRFEIKASGPTGVESITCFNVSLVEEVYQIFDTDMDQAKIRIDYVKNGNNPKSATQAAKPDAETPAGSMNDFASTKTESGSQSAGSLEEDAAREAATR